MDRARNRNRGKPAVNEPAKGPSDSGEKGKALAQIGNAYAKAAADPEWGKANYPLMFGPDGKILPRAKVISRVNERFGR